MKKFFADKKVCAKAHTCAERGRVSDNFPARECA